jgi:hypothetical protein
MFQWPAEKCGIAPHDDGKDHPMRLISSLCVLAALTVATPALAQTSGSAPSTPAPAAQPDASGGAPAATPPKPRTPNPEGVSDAADQSLWCGQAFVQSSDEVKQSGDQQGADAMLKDGNDLLAKGGDLLTKSGFDAAKVETTKTAYVTQVKGELAGDPSAARYSYEECLMLTPEGAASLGGGGASDGAGGTPASPAGNGGAAPSAP